ncbi:MAG: alpha/beta hydrolase [Myxococcales bacterium]|nr:alpha/beta hydrolase [Polyangiaceae bacterium]MDW8247747.1 alpha/beta hydrolase [Myxococcales bacterium]
MNLHTSHELPTAWHRVGTRINLQDGAVFVRTEGDLSTGVPLLLLHGFPTSCHDYVRVWGRLAARHPVVTLDFLGFGASDKPVSFSYSLLEQADIVLQVAARLGLREVHLVAHDMGTSVATELCARRERGLLPLHLRSLTLSNGSILLDLAHLTLAQKILRRPVLGELFARISTYTVFQHTLRSLLGDPDLIDHAELLQMWELMTRADGKARLPKISLYLEERQRFEGRWVGALRRLEGVPTLILWGAKDPVAVLAIGEQLGKLIPGARLRILSELGHYPQLEDPGAFAGELLTFLGEI